MNWFRTVKPDYLLIFTAFSLCAFILLSYFVLTSELNSIDFFLSKTVFLNRNIHTINFFEIETTILSPVLLSAYSIILIFYLLNRKEIFLAHILGLGMLLANISYLGIKFYIERQRPPFILDQIAGFSYPSGHATISALFFAFSIGAFTYRLPSSGQRITFVIICILLTIMTGFSRIYLGHHWCSDVVGGYLLGLFILFFTILNIRIAVFVGTSECKRDTLYVGSPKTKSLGSD